MNYKDPNVINTERNMYNVIQQPSTKTHAVPTINFMFNPFPKQQSPHHFCSLNICKFTLLIHQRCISEVWQKCPCEILISQLHILLKCTYPVDKYTCIDDTYTHIDDMGTYIDDLHFPEQTFKHGLQTC